LRLAAPVNHTFSTCAIRRKGIMPETDNPSKPSSAANPATVFQPAELTDSQYHEIADTYLDHALGIFEEIQDQKDELDVEYSVCTFYH
jgi:frataxin